MKSLRFEALFLDIGGVLLTNGWDRHMRRRRRKSSGSSMRRWTNAIT